jgi:3-oxoacyl-[acyl-carrier protein] reductase
MLRLDGQTAIVTGAGRGIGRAVASRLAAAGATVAIADIDYESAITASQDILHSFAVQTDVACVESVASTIETVLARRGSIDILINNAGIAGRSAPIWEQTDDDWNRMVAINLTGVFNFCRSVLPHMMKRKYGRIVNIASIAGKEGNPCMGPYSATKAGVIGLTKSLGKEVATEGICINAVAPAVVETPILQQLTTSQVEYMVERIPMRRTGKLEEIAAVVHFLSSQECSFVTAQCYDVSGGRATY